MKYPKNENRLVPPPLKIRDGIKKLKEYLVNVIVSLVFFTIAIFVQCLSYNNIDFVGGEQKERFIWYLRVYTLTIYLDNLSCNLNTEFVMKLRSSKVLFIGLLLLINVKILGILESKKAVKLSVECITSQTEAGETGKISTDLLAFEVSAHVVFS